MKLMNWALVLIALVYFTFTSADTWHSLNGTEYYIEHSYVSTYHQAADGCKQKSSILAVVKTPAVKNFLVAKIGKLYGKPYSFYIGLRKHGDDLVWSDGTDVSTGGTWWDFSQPKKYGEGDFVVMGGVHQLHPDFLWYNISANTPSRYICQRQINKTTTTFHKINPTTVTVATNSLINQQKGLQADATTEALSAISKNATSSQKLHLKTSALRAQEATVAMSSEKIRPTVVDFNTSSQTATKMLDLSQQRFSSTNFLFITNSTVQLVSNSHYGYVYAIFSFLTIIIICFLVFIIRMIMKLRKKRARWYYNLENGDARNSNVEMNDIRLGDAVSMDLGSQDPFAVESDNLTFSYDYTSCSCKEKSEVYVKSHVYL